MMEVQLRIILTVFIEISGLTRPVQPYSRIPNQAVTSKMNEGGKIRENFHNLFDSIAKNDPKRSESYLEFLKQEVAREQRAFGTMKEELQMARSRNSNRKRNFYRRDSYRNIVATKRETNASNQGNAALVAVTPLVGIESFYTTPWYSYNDEISPKMKTDICANIIRSPYFNSLNFDPVDPTDKGIFTILKEYYPDIYAGMYDERNSSAVLTNRYRRREVMVEDRVLHDFVFSCLALDRESGNITRFFVSKMYLLNNDFCRHHPDQMKGVFVFADKDEETVVVAMAEQPAYARVDPFDTPFRFDLTVNGSKYDKEHDFKHTICGLKINEKIRVCTLVLNADIFRSAVTFVPDQQNIDEDCYRGIMQLRNETGEVTAVDDWLIGCKAVKVDTDESVTYYVTAGFGAIEQLFMCVEPGRENVTMVAGVGCRINVMKKVKYLY